MAAVFLWLAAHFIQLGQMYKLKWVFGQVTGMGIRLPHCGYRLKKFCL
jgi:hypothetical protein